MRKTKEQKAITLIALIITIIVLLILALVTIRVVQGYGIINYAQKAKNDYERESDAENTTLGGYLSIIESNLPGGNNIVSGGAEETIGTIGIDTIAEINSTINGEAYSSTNPIIPAGFKAINTETSRWDAEGGPEVDEGLVITDGNSEFVWVPVTSTIAAYGLGTEDYREPDVVTGVVPSETVDSASGTEYDAKSDNLTLAECTEDLNGDNVVNAYDFKIQLENEFNAMATSVNTYGGFYVGRYEMSLSSDGIAQSKYGESSSTTYSTDTKTWYGLYGKAKTYSTASVQSSMIWGSQYDAMMNWMGEAANTTITGGTLGAENTTNTTGGTVKEDIIKNVYRLYEGRRELTIEANGKIFRIARGGYYDGFSTPSARTLFCPNSDGFSHMYGTSPYGSRLALYIV